MEQDKTYWCFRHSAEAENYLLNNANPPRTPWEGKLRVSENGLMTLHHFWPDGKIDEDSNAYAFVKKEDLFETFEDAKKAFMEKSRQYQQHLKQYSEEYDNYLEEYELRGSPNNFIIYPQL